MGSVVQNIHKYQTLQDWTIVHWNIVNCDVLASISTIEQ